jgi:aminopeptidase N
MAVNNVENLRPESRKTFAEKLADMATHDPKSLVRADALHVLYAITGDKYSDLYRDAMYDSSYMVSGSAMYLFSMMRPEDFGNIASTFENDNNVNIVIPLASFYIDTEVADKYNWFVDKLNHAPSDGLWYLLQYFGEYMMKAPELTQRRSVAVLENYARNHKKIYVRLAAYQALGLLSDLSGVDSLREDIRNNESDAYLRQLYQSIL